MTLRTVVSLVAFAFALRAAAAPPAPAPAAKLASAAVPAAAPGPAADSPTPAAPAAADPGKAEGRFKNIESFKGYPADDVIPAMEFISDALGVDCDYCHVDQAPEKDDKEEKKTARKMIAMTFAINKDHFDGHREVTCMSCHHGATHPASIPLIAAEAPEEAPAVAKAADLPTAGAVLDKYVQALGGTAALARIASRVQKGNLTGFGPGPIPVAVAAKAPDKRVTTVHAPRGDSVTAVNGPAGWQGGTGRPARDMSAAERDAARLDAAVLFGSDLKPLFKEFKLRASERIDGKDTLKVVARNEGKPPAVFWFDAQSGLLVRLVRYLETPLGRNPTQIDVADYREADGVKSPFRWTVARPGGRFTIQLESSQQNAEVADATFEKPR